MGRSPCCDNANVKKGPWSPEEDAKLKSYIERHGTGGNWITLPRKIGLKRCGKSCRLRWLNYLRPNLKRGDFSEEEDNIICSLYITIGSRWSIIAGRLPGRTDNDIKNYWNTKLKKKLFGRKPNPKQQQNPRRKYHQPKQQNSSTGHDDDAGPGVVADAARRNASATLQPAPPPCHGELAPDSSASPLDAMAVSSSSSSSSSLGCDWSGLSTELNELFRFGPARLQEELDYWLGGVGQGVDWNEDMMIPSMASSPGAVYELCDGMQCWPLFEEELQAGMLGTGDCLNY